MIGGLESGPKGFEFPSLGADALGERIRLSLPVMSESGAPIYPFESKSVLRYYWRSKAKTSQMDTSLFDEAVIALNAPTMLFLGASSQALGGTMVQSSPKPGGGVVDKSPLSSFLRRSFLLPSVPFPLGGCVTPIAEKGVDVRLNGLTQSRKWLVCFGPSGEIVVWD